jgi:hypothetical protein
MGIMEKPFLLIGSNPIIKVIEGGSEGMSNLMEKIFWEYLKGHKDQHGNYDQHKSDAYFVRDFFGMYLHRLAFKLPKITKIFLFNKYLRVRTFKCHRHRWAQSKEVGNSLVLSKEY